MIIKVPRTLRSGHTCYGVKLERYMQVDENYGGVCNIRTGTIKIDPDAADKEAVLIHEKLEQIAHAYSIKNLSHEALSVLANGIMEFLRYDLDIQFDWGDIEEK